MSRFALQLKKYQSETADLYAKASPLLKALAARIMEPFNPDEEANPLGDDAQAIQDVFNGWPADQLSERLAQLTYALSGYSPKLARRTPGIGRCYKHNKVVWCVVAIEGGTAYAINSNATSHSNINTTTNISIPPYAAELHEHGAFAKELLATDGAKIYQYIHGQFGAQHANRLLQELGVAITV